MYSPTPYIHHWTWCSKNEDHSLDYQTSYVHNNLYFILILLDTWSHWHEGSIDLAWIAAYIITCNILQNVVFVMSDDNSAQYIISLNTAQYIILPTDW